MKMLSYFLLHWRDMSRGPESSLLGSQKPDHIREWNQLEFTEFLSLVNLKSKIQN